MYVRTHHTKKQVCIFKTLDLGAFLFEAKVIEIVKMFLNKKEQAEAKQGHTQFQTKKLVTHVRSVAWWT